MASTVSDEKFTIIHIGFVPQLFLSCCFHIFFLMFSIQRFDYDVTCGFLVVHSVPEIYSFTSSAKFGKFLVIISLYTFFSPVLFLLSLFTGFPLTQKVEGMWLITAWQWWNFGSPHDLLWHHRWWVPSPPSRVKSPSFLLSLCSMSENDTPLRRKLRHLFTA